MQLPLDVFQTSNIIPGDVGNFNNRLSQSWWVALAQGPLHDNDEWDIFDSEGFCRPHSLHTVVYVSLIAKQMRFYKFYLEVIHGDSKRVHDFSINSLILEVDKIHLFPDGLQGSLRAESSQICAHMSMGLIGYLQSKYTKFKLLLLR